MYVIQHCFICRSSDFIVSEDAGIEPRTDAILALTNMTHLLTGIGERYSQTIQYLCHCQWRQSTDESSSYRRNAKLSRSSLCLNNTSFAGVHRGIHVHVVYCNEFVACSVNCRQSTKACLSPLIVAGHGGREGGIED
jgi:hypothetical protein